MKTTLKIHGINVPSDAHTLVTGLPGSGKTRSVLRPMLQAYLSRDAHNPEVKVGLLLLDPKGDMLPWIRALLKTVGREKDLFVIAEREHGFNFLSQLPLTPMQIAARLSQLGNALHRVSEVREDDEFWRHQQRQMIEALVEVAQTQILDRPIRVGDLCALHQQIMPNLRGSIEAMVHKYQLDQLPEAKGTFRNYAALPSDTRECVASTVANCVSVFRRPPLVELMNPSADKEVDLLNIIQEGACVVVSVSTRSYGDSTLPLLMSVKEAFADLVLSRSELEIDQGHGWGRINQEREVLYVADEVHRVLKRGDAGGELDFLDMCREFRCRGILATQSISALQSVMGIIPANRLVSLCGNHFFLNNIDPPTCEWAERMFRSHGDESLPPPLLMPSPRQRRAIDWEGPQTLSTLATGEFLLRTREGNAFRKKARLTGEQQRF